MSLRLYPIKVSVKEGSKETEERPSVDAEDLLDLMIELELNNYNILENWIIIRNKLGEAMAQMLEKKEKKQDEPTK